MANTLTTTIGKHQRVIMLTVAVAALATYIVPFANLFDYADAQSNNNNKKTDKKTDNGKKKAKTIKDSSAVRISLSQNALINSGIVSTGGGGSGGTPYSGTVSGTTGFNFITQNQQVCTGTSICANAQAIQFQSPGGYTQASVSIQ